MTQIEYAEFFNKHAAHLMKGRATQASIGAMERGERAIPVEYAKVLHDVLDMNYEWWFDRTGRRKANKQDKNTTLTDISQIRSDYAFLSAQYKKLDKTLKQVYADFYELVNKLDVK